MCIRDRVSGVPEFSPGAGSSAAAVLLWLSRCVDRPVSYTHLDVYKRQAQTAHVKVVIIQMFQPCRKAAPIRVIHLNHTAIWNTIEVVVVAVDEQNICLLYTSSLAIASTRPVNDTP